MNIFVIFFICCLVISILIIIIGRKQVDNTNSQTPIAIELKNGKNVVGKFFQALETIEILQNTTEWETFTIRVDFLQELSQSLMVAFITEQDKETASRQYLQAYGKKTLSMRQ